MATAAFSRDAPTMADMGYGAAELDALVKSAGDAVLAAAPTTGTAVTDHDAEWEGMPEFEQKDKTAHRSVIVHFRNDEDVAAFLLTLGVDLSGSAKYMWHPPQANRDLHSQAYVDE
jgi:hypothetical protein